LFTKRFALDLLERTIRTFIQAFLGALLAAPVFNLDIPTLKAAAMAGFAAVAAVLMGVVTGPIGADETPSVIPEPGPGDYPPGEPARSG
jgi:hypothetical protein